MVVVFSRRRPVTQRLQVSSTAGPVFHGHFFIAAEKEESASENAALHPWITMEQPYGSRKPHQP